MTKPKTKTLQPIGMLAPSELKPWKSNPRNITEDAVDRVAESIKRFGFGAPIVARKKNLEIIAGHTRWRAAKKLGLKSVPVRLMDIDEDDAHVLALADNRYTELTGWSADLVKQLEQYKPEDIHFAGWTDEQFNRLKADLLRGEEMEDDDVPEPPTNPVTKLGDTWKLGPHRLRCGDNRVEAEVIAALGGSEPFIMVTDPPYGIEYDGAKWKVEAGLHAKISPRQGLVDNDDNATWLETYALFKGAVAYVWHGHLQIDIAASDLERCHLQRRALIVWAKPEFVIGRGHYQYQHETCWYAVREGKSASWVGDRKQSTLWTISRRDGSEATVHSTQKPLECMARAIRNHGGSDDVVYDPFLGSGTTLIAADKLGRKCMGLELNPAYCDVIVERWQNLTGGKASRT